jgi:protoheme IX farnesyltransferase
MGRVYIGAAVVLGGVFTWHASRLGHLPEPRVEPGPNGGGAEAELRVAAMRLFTWSITYITLLFAAMAADQLLRSGW